MASYAQKMAAAAQAAGLSFDQEKNILHGTFRGYAFASTIVPNNARYCCRHFVTTMKKPINATCLHCVKIRGKHSAEKPSYSSSRSPVSRMTSHTPSISAAVPSGIIIRRIRASASAMIPLFSTPIRTVVRSFPMKCSGRALIGIDLPKQCTIKCR